MMALHIGEDVISTGHDVETDPYQSETLVEYFSKNRRCWSDLYPSERWLFDRLANETGGLGSVLDVGCAMGGVGHALAEREMLASYTGIDISDPLIRAGLGECCDGVPFELQTGDITTASTLGEGRFDTVLCLSVADWSAKTYEILNTCWLRVKPTGSLVLSLRLTELASVLDPDLSFQFLGNDVPAPHREAEVERVPYVVFDVRDALRMLCSLTPAPSRVLGYGYWGTPSATARTPFQRLAFVVFAVTRPAIDAAPESIRTELHLPADLLVTGEDEANV